MDYNQYSKFHMTKMDYHCESDELHTNYRRELVTAEALVQSVNSSNGQCHGSELERSSSLATLSPILAISRTSSGSEDLRNTNFCRDSLWKNLESQRSIQSELEPIDFPPFFTQKMKSTFSSQSTWDDLNCDNRDLGYIILQNQQLSSPPSAFFSSGSPLITSTDPPLPLHHKQVNSNHQPLLGSTPRYLHHNPLPASPATSVLYGASVTYPSHHLSKPQETAATRYSQIMNSCVPNTPHSQPLSLPTVWPLLLPLPISK